MTTQTLIALNGLMLKIETTHHLDVIPNFNVV